MSGQMQLPEAQSPEAQYQLALKMPIESLMAIMQGRPSEIDQTVALIALKQKNRLKTAAQGRQAQQQLQQPNVKDREMQIASMPENQGIGTLPSPNMGQVATMAHGGVIDNVQHFQVGGGPNINAMTAEEFFKYLNSPNNTLAKPAKDPYAPKPIKSDYSSTRAPITPRVAPTAGPGVSFAQAFPGAPSTAAGASAASLAAVRAMPLAARLAAAAGPAGIAAGIGGAAGYGLGRGVMNLIPGSDQAVTDLIAKITGLSKREAEMLDPQQKNELLAAEAARMGPPSGAPQQNTAAPAPAPAPAPAAPQEGITTLPRSSDEIAASKSLGDAPALTPEQVQARMTGNPAASALAPAPAAGIDALKRPDFTAIASKTNAANPFSTQLTDAIKELTPSSGERKKQGDDRNGLMLIFAAGELLKSGTTESGARGSALGQIGNLTQQYAKEDREDKRALLGAKISVLGTQATLAQGDMKSAIDLFNHGETTAMHYAKIESDKTYHDALLTLEGSKLSQTERIAKARQAGEDTHRGIMAQYYKAQEPVLAAKAIYYRAGAAAQGSKGTMTAAQYGAISAKSATAVDKFLATPGAMTKLKKDPAYKDFTDTQIRDNLIRIEMQRSMPDIDMGIAALSKPPSIQIPDSSDEGKRIFEMS